MRIQLSRNRHPRPLICRSFPLRSAQWNPDRNSCGIHSRTPARSPPARRTPLHAGFCAQPDAIQEFSGITFRNEFLIRNLQERAGGGGAGRTMNRDRFQECRHIKHDGAKCHSPAMRGTTYCYFHANARPSPSRHTRTRDALLDIPSMENRSEILVVLNRIVNALANGQIASRRATAMLYAVQMAQKELE